MCRWLWPCLILAGVSTGRAAPGDEVRVVDFGQQVRPILARACASCHGPDRQKGGLRLDRKALALQGGDSGPAIVPGKSSVSLLLERVTSTDASERMPQNAEPLPAAEVELLRAWIDAGAPWPAGMDVVRPGDGPTWWSLRPVGRVTVPLDDSRWARNAIDAFVLARLREAGLGPSPEADRRTLIRRVSLDLLGLPPSPEEVEDFATDSSPSAYEALVDRLLASPRHGERWGQHWLDVIRYGDTHGFEVNTPRPNAWPFRDWVIRSLNRDKPYDRFVTEQVAGDVLGEDAATGFLVAGPALLPGQVGKDEPSMRQARQDELHETVSTTGSTFLGLTVGCARCHSHKFDPIPQSDYYALQAVFAGLRYEERPLRGVDDVDRRRERGRVAAELSRVELELDQLEPLAAVGEAATPRRIAVRPGRNVERFAPVEARMVRFVIEATNDGIEPCIDELEVFSTGPSPRNVALASAGAVSRASSTYANSPLHRLEHLCDGRYGNSRSWISREPGKGWVQVELARPARIDRVVWGRDREGRYLDRLAVTYRIEVATEPDNWRAVASSADRLPHGAKEPDDAAADPGRRALRKEADALARRMAVLSVEPMVFAGSFQPPAAPTFRLHRGDPMQPREAVAPEALSALRDVLGPIPFSNAPEPERRRALARWITDGRNPLTARVMVNRLWQYHFGTGLVDTPSDFGRNGARPTHPELLDHLARALVESGWSLKAVHRLIVLSSTYRQADRPRPEALQIDAQSRLLWRFPPRRLEAEAIRDAMLTCSGVLESRMGGPGFLAFKPNDNYVRVYDAKEDWGPDDWRRMVYMHKVRMAQDGVFGVFDCPDAGQPAPRRSRSTTALQALSLFNSTFVAQQSDLFARRVAREAGTDPDAQIARAFRLALGRDPSDGERVACAEVVREHGLAALGRVLFNTNEFLFLP